MYLDDIAYKIRLRIPDESMPQHDTEGLLRMYAVLLRAKGANVTQSDVHDAWCAWMAERDRAHPSLVDYARLPEDVQKADEVFTSAIRQASAELDLSNANRPSFVEVLFPQGITEAGSQQSFELYKMMVASSESLVTRRHAVNTFFLTMNGALLTASGLIIQSSDGNRLGGFGIAVLALAGAILCTAWRSLIVSFGQLNRGKFKVINAIERNLKAAIYAAEWEALGRGEDPKIYRSFTSREIWVPNALLIIHALAAMAALDYALSLREKLESAASFVPL